MHIQSFLFAIIVFLFFLHKGRTEVEPRLTIVNIYSGLKEVDGGNGGEGGFGAIKDEDPPNEATEATAEYDYDNSPEKSSIKHKHKLFLSERLPELPSSASSNSATIVGKKKDNVAKFGIIRSLLRFLFNV